MNEPDATATEGPTEGPTETSTETPTEAVTPPLTEERAVESGRHPVNIGHLVMGIAFTGLALVWLLHQGDLAGNDSLRWLLPVPWVLAGTAGLVATALASRRRHHRPPA